MRKFFRLIQSCRVPLAALAGGLAAVAAFYLLRGNAARMQWWVSHVSMPVKRGLGAVTDLVPFSVCELGATLLILAALVLLIRCFVLRRGFLSWLLHVGALVAWGYALVCALWGTQYYAPTFAQTVGMEAPAVSVEQLETVATYLAARVNETAGAVPREELQFAVSTSAILQDTTGLYDAITQQFPCLAGPERRAKPAFYSKLMSAWGFTGYLCPLVGESTLNVDCPAVFLPVTVTHEFAHQRGVASEQEANFVAVVAATTSGRAIYAYSGWLFAYLHVSNALYSADSTRATACSALLCAEAHADFAANNAYWASWQGPVRETGEKVYTAFLQSYGQTLGMQSYGACVDLLVEYYLPIAEAAEAEQ
jgi:hypothetical protein